MKTIFVTYGNKPYYDSLKRIRKEAQDTGIFDIILTFTDQDCPPQISNSLLFRHKRGGGYWVWKPWAVLQALKIAGENDIVVYSDCGNTIFDNKSSWHNLFHKLRNRDAMFFYNGGRMKYWTRKNVFEAFPVPFLQSHYQIISNFFIVKKSAQTVIEQWRDVMLNSPQLVMDVPEEEQRFENKAFIEHRHDQAVLSAIVYSMVKRKRILILPENTERLRPGSCQAVFNSRISDTMQRSPFVESSRITLTLLDFVVKPVRRLQTAFFNLLPRRKNHLSNSL